MASLLSVALLAFLVVPVHAVPTQGGGPMGGPMMQREPVVPSQLPRPAVTWLASLSEVLAIEEHSQAQYEADSAKYPSAAPYAMVLVQERDHIRWIRQLFAAYGATPTARQMPLRPTNTLAEALEVGRSIEADLLTRYDELLAGASDPSTREVLGVIRHQTRRHLMMFEHARGGGMGRGPMGRD